MPPSASTIELRSTPTGVADGLREAVLADLLELTHCPKPRQARSPARRARRRPRTGATARSAVPVMTCLSYIEMVTILRTQTAPRATIENGDDKRDVAGRSCVQRLHLVGRKQRQSAERDERQPDQHPHRDPYPARSASGRAGAGRRELGCSGRRDRAPRRRCRRSRAGSPPRARPAEGRGSPSARRRSRRPARAGRRAARRQ